MSDAERKQTKWWHHAALSVAAVAMLGYLVAQRGWGILALLPVILTALLISEYLGGRIAARLYKNRTDTDD